MRAIPAELLRIDWRQQTKQIAPYIGDQGGVVCVIGGPHSACNTFVKLVRNELASKKDSICVELNPDDPTTHTPVDIVVKLGQTFGVQPSSPNNMSVASNIDAGGDVSINNVSVFKVASHMQQASELRLLEQSVINKIRERVASCKVAIVQYNWHEVLPPTVRWFWNNLWFDNLEHCVKEGFLLLCADETPDGGFRKDNVAADPDCLICLPSQYTGQDRADAVEDVARLLASSTKEALELTRPRADSLLFEWRDQPELVHSALVGHRLRSEYS